MSDLSAYLAAARTKPWGWREHDCTAFPAIWAGFADELPDYSNEDEAEAMLHAAGGLVPLWDDAVSCEPRKAEPVATHSVEPGDVGVIELLGPDMTAVEVGAIWTGQRWAFVPMAGGLAAISSATVLKAWRPRCLRR
jgi:hypothetical protein